MASDLKNDKMWGEGHNYQKKYGFMQGMMDCFEPPMIKTMSQTPEAKEAYKNYTAAPGKGSKKDY